MIADAIVLVLAPLPDATDTVVVLEAVIAVTVMIRVLTPEVIIVIVMTLVMIVVILVMIVVILVAIVVVLRVDTDGCTVL